MELKSTRRAKVRHPQSAKALREAQTGALGTALRTLQLVVETIQSVTQ